VKHLFADSAYDRLKLMDKAAYLDFIVEIIRRSDDQKGFQVLPRRWVGRGARHRSPPVHLQTDRIIVAPRLTIFGE
jgi:hypothetical protein